MSTNPQGAAASAGPSAPLAFGQVLSPEEAALWADAAGAFIAAQAEAARLIAAARSEASAIRDDARRRGSAEGREEAAAEGARLLGEAGLALRRQAEALQSECAVAIAEGVALVLGEVPEPERVARAARTALAGLADRVGRVALRVPPGTATAVRAALGAAVEELIVLEDPALPGDGCLLETPAGSVEAGIGPQLRALRLALGPKTAEAR